MIKEIQDPALFRHRATQWRFALRHKKRIYLVAPDYLNSGCWKLQEESHTNYLRMTSSTPTVALMRHQTVSAEKEVEVMGKRLVVLPEVLCWFGRRERSSDNSALNDIVR